MSVLGSNVWVVWMSGLVDNKFLCGFQLVNWSSFGKLATLWSSVESVDPPGGSGSQFDNRAVSVGQSGGSHRWLERAGGE